MIEIKDFVHWKLDKSPWKLSEDIIIDESGTLKIDSGVKVETTPGVSITIKGGIYIDGVTFDNSPIINCDKRGYGYIKNCFFGKKDDNSLKL